MDIRRLIGEIHRRSLWQVTAIYLGSSWVVLQVTQHVVAQFHLPEWTYGAALMLLLLGLPIVLATAFVQEGGPRTDPSLPPAEQPARPARGVRERGSDDWSHRMLTWRNAFVGAIGATALWGVVAAGWLLVAPSQGREAHPAGEEPAGIRALDTVAGDTADRVPVRMAAEPAAESSRADRPPPIRQTEVDDAAERAREQHAERLRTTLAAGVRAREAGAPERGFDLTMADSLVEEGRRPTGDAGAAAALRDLAGARALYDDAARRAARGWRAAVDSAATAVEDLRKKAGEGEPGYAEGELHRSEGRHAVRAGDFRTALDRYREAAADFERAGGEEEIAARAEPPLEPATESGNGEAGKEAHGPALPAIRAAVVATLERLERALEAEDPAAVREVWVTMDGETERGFRSFFDRIRDFDVAIEVRWETLAATDDRATVTGLTTWSYHDEDRRERVTREPFEQGFELVRRDGAWVLVRY